jgi:transposase InsO family protein
VLAVSRSGFYHWRGRPASATAERRTDLQVLIYQAFWIAGDGAYGYRRVHAHLARGGVECSPELVRRIMRDMRLVPCQPRPWRTTTVADASVASTPDLVGRDFDAAGAAPGAVMVGDITYVKTRAGWLNLATVLDCATKMVLGYAMAEHMRADLVIAAIDMAARRHDLPAGAVFHSDRGVQYGSEPFRARLRELGIRPSVGRTGVCWDNAMAESFNGALKNECVYRTVYPTRKHAERDIVRYIELFYNQRRLHSKLGYRPPIEVYRERLELTAA